MSWALNLSSTMRLMSQLFLCNMGMITGVPHGAAVKSQD